MIRRGYCVHCRIWSDRLDRAGWCPECAEELATGKRRWYWEAEALEKLVARLAR